ncbi:hypothetical protein OHS18_38985 [Amycolatopsis sp. NBC_00355]|uniref:DUF6939 family protein n=1 Tax=Amycolatopsis sp. NBC_00355 TaxID=2975957 RepID=UPI002E26833A
MAVHVVNRRRNTVAASHPGALIADVTSRGPEPWVRFSPFYPHGGIPVPYSPGVESASVEGIWQALKVFRGTGIDVGKLGVTSMKGLKRTVRKHGEVVGHRTGVEGSELLAYEQARRRIYLPSYRWVLENRLADLVGELREASAERDIVLLDYTTNGDVENLSKPLSHAALLRTHLTGEWPCSL